MAIDLTQSTAADIFTLTLAAVKSACKAAGAELESEEAWDPMDCRGPVVPETAGRYTYASWNVRLGRGRDITVDSTISPEELELSCGEGAIETLEVSISDPEDGAIDGYCCVPLTDLADAFRKLDV